MTDPDDMPPQDPPGEDEPADLPDDAAEELGDFA